MSAEQLLSIIEFNQYEFGDLIPYILAYLLCLWLLFTLWVVRDIASRTSNPIVILTVFVFVLVFNIPGLILYMLLRPEKTVEEARALDIYHMSQLEDNLITCHSCISVVRKSYNYCSVCGSDLYAQCEYCDHRIDPIWTNCVYCGNQVKDSNQLLLLHSLNLIWLHSSIWSIHIARIVEFTIDSIGQIYLAMRRAGSMLVALLLRIKYAVATGVATFEPLTDSQVAFFDQLLHKKVSKGSTSQQHGATPVVMRVSQHQVT